LVRQKNPAATLGRGLRAQAVARLTLAGLERELHSLKANASACANDQNRTHRVKLSLLTGLLKIALGPCRSGNIDK
jgi:hypothetical protein